MANRLLLAYSLALLASMCLQKAHGQAAPVQGDKAATATPDQEAHGPACQASSASKIKASAPMTADQSSTVGDPATSGPLNIKGKLRYFAIESFRPGIYPVAAFYDGLTMANPPRAYPPEWRQGFPGFARNYGDFMASWASVQGGKFVAASILHEDPRYFTSTNKNFFARVFNAARYAVIDRSDSGDPRLALANVAGAFAGGFVGDRKSTRLNSSHGYISYAVFSL